MSGVQQSSSKFVTTDSRFTNIEKTLNEISNMVENHQINATYDPSNPKWNQIPLGFARIAENLATW